MISAIAARKAAQAARQQHTQHPSQSPSQPSPTSPPQSSKRKPSSQDRKPASKKRKRDKDKPTKTFADSSPSLGLPKSQDDVIVVDSDSDPGSDSDSEKPEGHSLSEESGIEAPAAPPPPHLTARAWSPSVPLRGSSSEEDSGADASGLIDLPTRFRLRVETKVGTILSTFSPTPGNNIFFLSAGEIRELGLNFREEATASLVVLDNGDRICLLGRCKITVLRGSISVNGVILPPSRNPHTIFAPRSSPLPVIEYRTSSTKALVDAASLPQSLESHDSTKSALFLIQELETNVETLGRVCGTFGGVYELPHPRKEDNSVTSPFRINGLHLVNKQTRDFSPFEMLPSWSASLVKVPLPLSAPSDPIFLVKGPKKCGKSTFARTLLNMLLTHYKRVAFLDCDPGQSEFTPGGFVSLNVVTQPVFGPPYTHPMLPFRAHFIAATTPKTSPSTYLDGVKDLIDAWRVDIMHVSMPDELDRDERVADIVPLIVNTMGWSKGLGADLMRKIEETIEPGHVFGFEIDDSFSYSYPSQFPSQRRNPDAAQIHVLEPAPLSELSTNYTPADHRTLSILSYFHATFPQPLQPPSHEPNFNQLMAQTWDTILPLCAIRPFEVDVCTAFDQIILTGAGSEDVVPDELSRVLNGALVGFVQLNHQTPTIVSSQADSSSLRVPYTQCQPPPSPSESSCIGLGLIRGVSFPPTSTEDSSSRAILHILTPVPPAMVTGARILVKGEMELPIWGMLDFRQFNNGDTGGVAGVEKDRVPYLQWGRSSEAAIGAEKRRVRRNLMRRGQA